MAIDITLQSPAPPPAVLASIRRMAGEWRESRIPQELRADRILVVEGYVEGEKFRFGYVRRWYWRGEAELQVRGTVRAGPAGGSIVTMHCGSRSWVSFAAVLAFGAIAPWFFRGDWLGWAFFAAVVAMVVTSWLAEARISRTSNPQADYLVGRIEAAVAAAA